MSKEHESSEVSDKIFEEFLVQLTNTGISADIISQLRKLLLEDRNLTDSAIRAVLLSEDQPQ